jgi:Tfp pilus assembly protein PilN
MIRINLLPARKAKRQAEPGLQPLFIGLGAIAVAAVIVLIAFDLPRRSELSTVNGLIDDLNGQIKAKRDQLKGYDDMKTAFDKASSRVASIKRLESAKIDPAWVMQELGQILTPTKNPTMTHAMGERVIGQNADPNKKFAGDWDPSHVWLTSFADKAGTFKLEGGAQSESDVIQLSLRLQASVYFADIAPASGERVSDRDTGLNYYKFTITGKLVY